MKFALSVNRNLQKVLHQEEIIANFPLKIFVFKTFKSAECLWNVNPG